MEYIARRLVALAPKIRKGVTQSSFNPALLDKPRLRDRWQLGMVVIRSSDENWRAVVETLIKSSTLVCIDISNPSKNIMTEVSLLARLTKGKPVVWIGPKSVLPSIKVNADGYTVFDVPFAGRCHQFLYPDGDNTPLYRWLDGGNAMQVIRAHANELLAAFPDYEFK